MLNLFTLVSTNSCAFFCCSSIISSCFSTAFSAISFTKSSMFSASMSNCYVIFIKMRALILLHLLQTKYIIYYTYARPSHFTQLSPDNCHACNVVKSSEIFRNLSYPKPPSELSFLIEQRSYSRYLRQFFE